MRVYFAHPVSDYGTDRQAKAIAVVAAHFFDLGRPLELENPDSPQHQAGYKSEGMPYFERLVDTCQGLVFMRFPSGGIGAGVAKEIKRALVKNLTVWEVFGGRLHHVSDMPTPVLSVDETRQALSWHSEWNAPDGLEVAAKWHEAEAERIRLLALDSDYPRRFHEAQDDHLSHASAIRSLVSREVDHEP